MRRIEGGICVTVGLLAVLVSGVGSARAEPPIRSAEDAACRAEAKAHVFSAPNPRGLPIEEVGKRIYFACMDRIAPRAKSSRRRGRRHSR